MNVIDDNGARDDIAVTDSGTIKCQNSAGNTEAQGAHLLADALLGRDLLGYDPIGSYKNSSQTYIRWDTNNARRGPYLDPDTVANGTVFEDAQGGTVGEVVIEDRDAAPDGSQARTLRFLMDQFESPILYYRANPNAQPNWSAHVDNYAPPARDLRATRQLRLHSASRCAAERAVPDTQLCPAAPLAVRR